MSILQLFQLFAWKQHQQQQRSKTFPPGWAIDALCVVVLLLYFLYFALPALGGHLAEDEPPELYRFWYHGWLKWIWANIFFWRQTKTFFRPAGVFYYLPLYHCFGLNPRPYHIAQISILAASIPMIYYLARSLSSSRSVAFLAVLALCYHVGLTSLVFIGSFSYDILCGFFYFAALTYYIHFRERDAQLRSLQLVGFLALYVGALDFKEMAVSLPVIVLIYEVLKSPRWGDWKQLIRWAYSSTIPALIAGLITAVYIYFRIHGPTSLATADAYRPRYSWSTFLKSNASFVSELFYGVAISDWGLLALWALVFIYAFLRRDRMLRLMAFWVVIVPLPLAFIVPIRGGGHLYLLLFGWAMIFAKVASDLIELLCKFSLLMRQGARRMGAATGAITRSTPTGGVRGTATGVAAASNMSQTTLRIAATLVVALSLAIFTRWKNPPPYVRAFQNYGQKTSHVAQAFRSLDLRPVPGSWILVKGNPFMPSQWGEGWDVLFIPALLWNDHSLHILLEGLNKLTPQQVANMDYVILLSEFHAEIVRAPESQRR
jgi:hypothetical protein